MYTNITRIHAPEVISVRKFRMYLGTSSVTKFNLLDSKKYGIK